MCTPPKTSPDRQIGEGCNLSVDSGKASQGQDATFTPVFSAARNESPGNASKALI
jgi:hypothetical protein